MFSDRRLGEPVTATQFGERVRLLDRPAMQHSRELLAAALLCRYDHPLDECKIMNAEIDRRLTV